MLEYGSSLLSIHVESNGSFSNGVFSKPFISFGKFFAVVSGGATRSAPIMF